jgi:DMSO reductase anchor subunit
MLCIAVNSAARLPVRVISRQTAGGAARPQHLQHRTLRLVGANSGLGCWRCVAIKKWAAVTALAAATFYLVLSGAEVATQRSHIMSDVF